MGLLYWQIFLFIYLLFDRDKKQYKTEKDS